ncbi:hypothetical protein D9758_006912 [Tetrapyrgos nigripes]|uniref:Uncharacterized protein n=1 Tax=Tetrapyrgos nigripes TaxID=182062 RepID=A0A8H5LUY6_9AGAR|nr:hypothetical protein D9758_006912 [Tetrapyrgos nigripes]
MASIQAPSAPSFNLNPTLGPFVIAQDISAVLLSSLTIQIYLYLRRAPKDWRPLTILVILVWALELAGYVAGARFIYNFSITNFGDVEALVFDTPGGLSSTLWPSAVSVALTESFYLIHIRQLAPRRFWVTGLTLLGLLVTWIRCAGWLFLAVRVRNLDSFESPLSIMKIELAAGMLMEILIPLVMGILFWRNRKSATIMFEDLEQDGPLKWLEIVLRWIVQTGALARHVVAQLT